MLTMEWTHKKKEILSIINIIFIWTFFLCRMHCTHTHNSLTPPRVTRFLVSVSLNIRHRTTIPTTTTPTTWEKRKRDTYFCRHFFFLSSPECGSVEQYFVWCAVDIVITVIVSDYLFGKSAKYRSMLNG